MENRAIIMSMIGNNQPTKLSLADIIRATAISWASGAFTENQIRYCLKHDYKVAPQDIDSILIGCTELQKGMMASLISLSKKPMAAKDKNIIN